MMASQKVVFSHSVGILDTLEMFPASSGTKTLANPIKELEFLTLNTLNAFSPECSMLVTKDLLRLHGMGLFAGFRASS